MRTAAAHDEAARDVLIPQGGNPHRSEELSSRMARLPASFAGVQLQPTKRQEDNTDWTEEINHRIRTQPYMPMAAEFGPC